MKKVITYTLIGCLACLNCAHADTILIVDDNNVVKQQIYTGSTPTTSQVVTQQPVVQQVVTQQPIIQPVIISQPLPQPSVVVVRETIRPRNYHYDSFATSMVGGVVGSLVGHTLFHHRHHHH